MQRNANAVVVASVFAILTMAACGGGSGSGGAKPGDGGGGAVAGGGSGGSGAQGTDAGDTPHSDGGPGSGGAGPPSGNDGAGGSVSGDGGSESPDAEREVGGPEGGAGRIAVLMVVGDSNGTVPVGQLSTGDQFTKNRLESMLNCRVTPMQDTTDAAMLAAAAEAADLVIVVESVMSTLLVAKLRASTKPVLSFEAFIQDEMGLTAAGPAGDPGIPPMFALGVKASETSLTIVDPTHPLAAGLQGTVAVYQQPRQITWGTVAMTAEVVATLPGNAPGAAIYVYRKGARLFDGSTAAGLRLGFFLEDDNEGGTPNLMTPEGLRLFDTAVKFALNPTAKP